MYRSGSALLRYGPPSVLEVLGFYTLWWSIEVDGEAAVRGYILGVTQVVCATIMLAWLSFREGKRSAEEKLDELRTEVEALRDVLEAQGLIELINGTRFEHRDRSKIHLVDLHPME